MIQFLGLHLSHESASAAVLARDLTISAQVSTQMVNASKDAATGIVEVPIAEWVRAGSYALQEAYFKLPPAMRKAWGVCLSGPDGWVALDVAFEPVSPLRLTMGASIVDDLRRWLDADPRMSRKLSAILSPKDYFRFAVSGGLAADVTHASRLGFLQQGKSQWAVPLAEESGWNAAWLPPVFDSHVTTGRLSEEGIRKTSLPGGCWLVAGAHEDEAALVAAGDLRRGQLWAVERAGAGVLLAFGVPHLELVTPPAGWRVLRSAMAGQQVLEMRIESTEDAAIERAGAELEQAGFSVRGVSRARGDAAMGAAALAAVGSGLVRGWDNYYKNRVVA
jgi:hypothetical protein